MRKSIALIWLVLGCSVCAHAQTDNGRDLSKYADDKFSEDDKYQVETPYETVTVKQPKSKKLKKSSVKGSLKGSKIKTVQVKVGKKKDNKKYVKKYKKIFTKKNAGKKVKIR